MRKQIFGGRDQMKTKKVNNKSIKKPAWAATTVVVAAGAV